MSSFEAIVEEAAMGRKILFDGHLMDGAIVQSMAKGNPLYFNRLRALFLFDGYLMRGNYL